MPDFRFPHALTYPDNEAPTLTDIAHTLIAHDKLAPLISEILEKSLDGVVIERIKVELRSIEIGSLYEHFWVAIFLVFQKQLEEEVPDLVESMTGLDISDRYDTLVTVLVLILMFYGASYLIRRLRQKDGTSEPPPPHIQGNYNTYINIASSQLGMEPERLERVVEQVAKGSRARTVSRAAIDLFRPAKRGGDGRIVPRNTPEVSREAVAEFPSEAALADLAQDTEVETFPDVVLEIRATDRDKRKQGWAGVIHEVDKRRVPLTLFPTISSEDLAKARRARVDAMCEFKVIGEDDYLLTRIHVLAVHEILD
ncbi:MAG TPA: hypothetical protein VGU45_02035 [Microvirga sp.]|jgi:hypothetical protein|nr:hypothetical protein [Microvirga sp.]